MSGDSKPDYSSLDRGLNIWRGDAIDLIRHVPELDLIVTDPPYAMGGDGAEHAISATVAVVLQKAGEKLRKGGWAIVFCASSWRSTAYMIQSVRGVLEPVRFGTWVKPKSRTAVRTPGWAWASVQVIAFRRHGKGLGEPTPEWLDWIEAPPFMEGRRAQLPGAVAAWAVAPFVVPGGLALDPFSGSGMLPAAAVMGGMDAIGFEIEHSNASWCDTFLTTHSCFEEAIEAERLAAGPCDDGHCDCTDQRLEHSLAEWRAAKHAVDGTSPSPPAMHVEAGQ